MLLRIYMLAQQELLGESQQLRHCMIDLKQVSLLSIFHQQKSLNIL